MASTPSLNTISLCDASLLARSTPLLPLPLPTNLLPVLTCPAPLRARLAPLLPLPTQRPALLAWSPSPFLVRMYRPAGAENPEAAEEAASSAGVEAAGVEAAGVEAAGVKAGVEAAKEEECVPWPPISCRLVELLLARAP